MICDDSLVTASVS